MDLSNGCTALGVAVALGEIEMPTDADVMHDRSLFSAVASCSSGVELDQAQVVVVGNTRGIGGRYRIGHSVMKDALDADGIWAAIRDAGLDLPDRPRPADLDGRLVNAFLKCEVSQDGGARPAQRHAGRLRCALAPADQGGVGGVAASVTGDPAVFVSVSAAHQGPDGGGPVAAIVDLGRALTTVGVGGPHRSAPGELQVEDLPAVGDAASFESGQRAEVRPLGPARVGIAQRLGRRAGGQHALRVGLPVGGQPEAAAAPQPGRDERSELGCHKSPLEVLGLRPGIGEEQPHLGQDCRARPVR